MDEYIKKEMAVRAAMRLSGDYAAACSEIDALPAVTLEEVHGRLICDPLTMDKPDAIGPEARRKARMALMEELETRDMICYEMRKGVLYASVWGARRSAAGGGYSEPSEWPRSKFQASAERQRGNFGNRNRGAK